ncbi:MAG: D-2-hydroxyacid dehydrogenase [Turicibacter sp.]|nr:D-2-hydroxyacid dehydrogenase [Turicibacter sp.]
MKRKVIFLTNIMRVNAAQKQRIIQNPELEVVFKHSHELDDADFEDAVAVIGNTKPSRLRLFKKLEWIQLYSAGANGYTDEGALQEGVILTNATGSYGVAISEHMLAQALMLQKKFHLYLDKQRRQDWSHEPGIIKSIHGSTVAIVGLGDIGTAFARLVKALGGYTIGIKRTVYGDEQFVDEAYPITELDQVLSRADVVAASLPSTPETHKLFDGEKFAAMKDGAIFLNVGRGTAVDLEALCDALESGKLWGASLDVTDPEPLPKGHRAWDTPNLVITPHVSGNFYLEETFNRFIDIAVENLGRFAKGEPLLNEVDFATGYKRRN